MKTLVPRLVQRLGAAGPELVRDATGLSGAALVAFGAGEIYRPAGFIVAGALLLAGAWLSARTRR